MRITSIIPPRKIIEEPRAKSTKSATIRALQIKGKELQAQIKTLEAQQSTNSALSVTLFSLAMMRPI